MSISVFSQKKWTLKDCVNHALDKNITIQQNKLNLEISKVEIKNAKGNFMPNVNASTNGRLNFGSTFDSVTNDRVSTSNFGGSISLNTRIPIFNGFRNLNTYKLAKLGVKSSELNLKIIENDISLQVLNAYLNVLFAKENIKVAQFQSEFSKKQFNQIEQQFKAGIKPKSDVLNIKSNVANDSQRLVDAENKLNLALLRLSQLIQVSSDNFDVENINTDIIPEILLYDNYADIYEEALSNRPEIKREKLNLKRADLNIKTTKSGYFPSVTASGSIGTNYGYNLDLPKGYSNTKFGTQLDNNLGYAIGLNINIPIFNGFKNDANVEKAKLNKKITETQLENQKLRLKQTIQQAFLDAKLAMKTFQSSKIAVEVQREAFKNSEITYKLGAITIFDFDKVRNRLSNAESSLIRAKYNYIFKTKVLQFYSGENILE